ncbi:dnaJ homolog subfamily C member 4 [Oenanthe melanoleuca]|uniref:dnaJ homolog subfamily C member 4 n=1 Tax=Oenanthe melanoleuca TaxID=2939378 RepID=UPI0024C1BA29|nr:dnaJ homolog subfamily C member 4 [Oenanthe melanoleuca]
MAARRAVAMGAWAAPPPRRGWTWRGLGSRPGPPDPHSVLGVRPGASAREIRAAFLARCKEVHPDGDPSDPSRHGRFLLLAEAYAALSPPRTPGTPPRDAPGAPPRPGTPPSGKQNRENRDQNRENRDQNRRYWEQNRENRDQNRRYWDQNRRYWEQFRPPGTPPRTSPRRVLGVLLLLMALGGLAHALAYRYLAGAHAAFLDRQDRELRAAYERARSRAGTHAEVLRRLRERGRGRGGGGGGEGGGEGP